MAFGTGSHPTTWLCLAWLEATLPRRRTGGGSYGCGSGILAIAAAKLAPPRCLASDIDPQRWRRPATTPRKMA